MTKISATYKQGVFMHLIARLFRYFDVEAYKIHSRNCRINFINDVANSATIYKSIMYPRRHMGSIIELPLDTVLTADMDELLAEYNLLDDKQLKIESYLRRTLNLCENTGDIAALFSEFLLSLTAIVITNSEPTLTKRQIKIHLDHEQPALKLIADHQMTLLLMGHQP